MVTVTVTPGEGRAGPSRPEHGEGSPERDHRRGLRGSESGEQCPPSGRGQLGQGQADEAQHCHLPAGGPRQEASPLRAEVSYLYPSVTPSIPRAPGPPRSSSPLDPGTHACGEIHLPAGEVE